MAAIRNVPKKSPTTRATMPQRERSATPSTSAETERPEPKGKKRST